MGQYGRVGGRRRGSAAWQWITIGFFPGLLCGGIAIFALALLGPLEGLFTGPTPTAPPPERIVMVVTATPDPDAPTPTAVVVTATPAPAEDLGEAVVVPPSTDEPTQAVTATESAAPATEVTPQSQSASETESQLAGSQSALPTVPGAANANPTPDIPPALRDVASPLVSIPGGTFTMGTTFDEVLTAVEECLTRDGGNCQPSYGEDASPQVQVQLEPYQMEPTEVTFRQYVAFLNYLRSQGSSHLNGCFGLVCIQTLNENPNAVITFDGANYDIPPASANFPVYAVTWYGARAYCEALGRRLPTEAEWERAARGELAARYPWGNEWSANNAKTRVPVDGPQGPVAVGSYPSGRNSYGMLDMAGNVEEWVNDWYDSGYYTTMANQPQPVTDPQGPVAGVQKVLRGGSWNAMPFFSRTMHRRSTDPLPADNTADFPRSVGFRCAADAATQVPISPGGVNPGDLGSGLGGTSPAGAAPTLPAAPETDSSTEDTNPGTRG